MYTVLADVNEKLAQKGKEKVGYYLQRKVDKSKITDIERINFLKNLEAVEGYRAGADADIVIEAATEQEQIKQQIFQELDEICEEKTILVSNTSTISVSMLGGMTRRPDRVMGIHFLCLHLQ